MKRQINTALFFLFISVGILTTSAQAHVADASPCGDLSVEECKVLNAVNSYRWVQNQTPLVISERCESAARAHARDMVVRGFFSHDSPTESWTNRMKRFGLGEGSRVGENIAQATLAADAIRAWMNSPPHRANILNGQYRETGIAVLDGRWVQCFYAD